jgi:hypothetical protein
MNLTSARIEHGEFERGFMCRCHDAAIGRVDVDGILCGALVDDGVQRFNVCVGASGVWHENGGTTG